MNLTTNARDAMPRGGTLTVSAADLDGASRCPHCGAGLIEGDYVSIDITDTGVGMDENVRRRLFEPFFSTKQAGKGTGLGLATVYGVVTQSGGHICVESAAGRGTAFHLCMPAAVREP